MNTYLKHILIVLILIGCKENNKRPYLENNDVSLAYLIDSLQLKKENLKIVIDKSDYRLSVLVDSKVIREYPVVFEANPTDDKLMEGDKATPEGHFQVRDFYSHKSWSKFIWIDYPTPDSYKKHNKAKSENRIPDEATIGGEIGIHGVPEGRSDLITEKVNWTLGCISLTNEAIDDLYEIVYKTMKIEIVK